jgi:hypothetical protein
MKSILQKLQFRKMIIILRLAYIGNLLQLTSSFKNLLPLPSEHKLAANEYLNNRVSTRPVHKREKKKWHNITDTL